MSVHSLSMSRKTLLEWSRPSFYDSVVFQKLNNWCLFSSNFIINQTYMGISGLDVLAMSLLAMSQFISTWVMFRELSWIHDVTISNLIQINSWSVKKKTGLESNQDKSIQDGHEINAWNNINIKHIWWIFCRFQNILTELLVDDGKLLHKKCKENVHILPAIVVQMLTFSWFIWTHVFVLLR